MSDKVSRFHERKSRKKDLGETNGMYVVRCDNENDSAINLPSSNIDTFESTILNYEKSFNVDYDRESALLYKHGAFEAYCSWCLEKSWHGVAQANSFTRYDYRCNNCKNYTLKCRVPDCEHMVTYKPDKIHAESQIDLVRQKWASEFCAEHDGCIPSFDTLNNRLSDLSEFKSIYADKKSNFAALAKVGSVTVLTAGTVASGAWLAAPWLASTFGSLGLLGAAGTGTAINSLSGAALTSASLAAIGPGGVAGGVGCLTAAGAALGAKTGAAIGAGYFGDIKDFDIVKVKDGCGPALIFINGFLSQKSDKERKNNIDELSKDWLASISADYPDNPCYTVTWESSCLRQLGSMGLDISGAGAKQLVKAIAKGTPKSGGGLLTALTSTLDLLNNPWHKAMQKASMTGVLLADIISRTDNNNGFILMGHSLGARVVYYTLEALATRKDKPLIKKAFCLGGAVGNCKDDWKRASSAVESSVYNIYSSNDEVLKIAYTYANAAVSKPIGINPIAATKNSQVVNFDATEYVAGHMDHKNEFGRVLKVLDK